MKAKQPNLTKKKKHTRKRARNGSKKFKAGLRRLPEKLKQSKARWQAVGAEHRSSFRLTSTVSRAPVGYGAEVKSLQAVETHTHGGGRQPEGEKKAKLRRRRRKRKK
jgi:hypothetical protein